MRATWQSRRARPSLWVRPRGYDPTQERSRRASSRTACTRVHQRTIVLIPRRAELYKLRPILPRHRSRHQAEWTGLRRVRLPARGWVMEGVRLAVGATAKRYGAVEERRLR
jgi:hypothetical protein